MGKGKFGQKARVLSGREARRYNERREAAEQKLADRDARMARINAMSPQERERYFAQNQRIRDIERNGITLEHMRQTEEEAYARGLEDGKNATFETCFAAICLALNELHGFGSKRCKDVLNAVYENMTMSLNSADAIQQVYERMGLEIRFNEGAAGVVEEFVGEASGT